MGWKKKLTLYTALTASTLGTIHLLNRFAYFLATVDNVLDNTKDNFYEWRFGNIHYSKKGSGKPILLVHDLNSSSSSYEWNKIETELTKTNTVYTLDLLGCGRSDKPNITYTNFLYVQMVTDFIKHIIKEKTDIVVTGESSSFILLSCANTDELIGQVMLINPSSLTEQAKIPTKRTKVLKYLIDTPIVGTLLYNILVNKKTIDNTFRRQYFYDQNKIEEKCIQTYWEASQKSNTKAKYLFSSICSRYTNANILFCIKNITNNIYIIYGNGNPEYAGIANQYQNQLPSIELFEIDHCKYLPQLECPSDLLAQIQLLINDSPEEDQFHSA